MVEISINITTNENKAISKNFIFFLKILNLEMGKKGNIDLYFSLNLLIFNKSFKKIFIIQNIGLSNIRLVVF